MYLRQTFFYAPGSKLINPLSGTSEQYYGKPAKYQAYNNINRFCIWMGIKEYIIEHTNKSNNKNKDT